MHTHPTAASCRLKKFFQMFRNIRILISKFHRSIHNQSYDMPYKARISVCNFCRKDFLDKSGHNNQKFCSHVCSNKGKIRHKTCHKRRRGRFVNCLVCHREFYAKRCLPMSIRNEQKYCSIKCKGIASRLKSVQCEFCGTTFKPKVMLHKKFCSSQCKSAARKNGTNVSCDYCRETIYLAKGRLQKAKHYFCSLAHQIKWQKRGKLRFICKICKKEFYWSPSRIKQQNPIYCSILCRDQDPDRRKQLLKMIAIQQNFYPNKLEKQGYKMLKSFKIHFDKQKVVGNKFVVDAYIPKCRTIIQFDGDYWHGNIKKFPILDKRQQRRRCIDKSQNAYFRKCGYHVIRIWESQMKSNPSYVRRLLMKKLALSQVD